MTVLFSIIVGLLFLLTGGVKVAGLRQSVAIGEHLGFGPKAWRLLGIVEAAGGLGVLVGLAWEPLALAALVGLMLLMIGAIRYRARASDSNIAIAFDAIVLALIAMTFVLVLS